ncbi:MAG TPA: hypothetical protein VGW58_11195 [Pyrinomonadaceae bacterium]|nr:hypothetical protein [Pyrinomonadaceae bacterium]
MKVNVSLLLFALLFFLVSAVSAQEPVSAAETADKLRLQLLDVQFQQENLKIRLQQLDEDLKPENIQRALAGIGSTRPEELRESRRRQLQIERDGVAAQLKVLETSRLRLEAAILDADARAYQESARPMQQGFIARSTRNKPLLIAGGASFVLFGVLASLYVRRRVRRRS